MRRSSRETIAAAAVINEVIAVIVAKKGFEWAGEFNRNAHSDADGKPCKLKTYYRSRHTERQDNRRLVTKFGGGHPQGSLLQFIYNNEPSYLEIVKAWMSTSWH